MTTDKCDKEEIEDTVKKYTAFFYENSGNFVAAFTVYFDDNKVLFDENKVKMARKPGKKQKKNPVDCTR